MYTHINNPTLTEGELHTSPQQQLSLSQLWAPSNKNISQFLYFKTKNLLTNALITPVSSSSPSTLHSPQQSVGLNLTTSHVKGKTQANYAYFNYAFSCSWTAFQEAFLFLRYPELLDACTLIERSLRTPRIDRSVYAYLDNLCYRSRAELSLMSLAFNTHIHNGSLIRLESERWLCH